MSREAKLFEFLSKELLSKLGYHIIKEDFTVSAAKGAEAVDLCINFTDDLFLQPQYAPKGFTFVECKESLGNNQKPLNDLEQSIKHANEDEYHVKRLDGQPVSGGLLLINEKGTRIDKDVINNAASKGFFLWDQSRIFFYAMKVFGHSVLENWVSQNRLGIVLNEEQIENQFHPDMFHTTVFVGVRYGEQLKNVEVYFSYYVDCLKSPEELDSQHDALHTENVKKILDDAHARLEEVNKKLRLEEKGKKPFTGDSPKKVHYLINDYYVCATFGFDPCDPFGYHIKGRRLSDGEDWSYTVSAM